MAPIELQLICQKHINTDSSTVPHKGLKSMQTVLSEKIYSELLPRELGTSVRMLTTVVGRVATT